MIKSFVFMFSLIVLSGCVSTKIIPIDHAGLVANKPSTIVITNRTKPNFSAYTPGKAMLGIIGAMAMTSKGNKIIANNAIDDPSRLIGSIIASDISSKYDLKLLDDGSIITETMKPSKISKLYPNSDLILDVKTTKWMFTYFPADFSHYRVIYNAKIRLINAKDSSILAEVNCSRLPKEKKGAPSYDEMLANNAKILKSELKIAVDYCVNEFRTKALNI